MRFLKIKCLGAFNSYRQPDFHTYHKTLPLPPKTTVAGLIGSALGISPSKVNEEWLLRYRFKMGIVGYHNGQANDLWQIRKYKDAEIKNYYKGKVSKPYFTAVIVRELLYKSNVTLYLTFEEDEDYELVKQSFLNPKWALSLGREDELIKIDSIENIELELQNGEFKLKDTVLVGDIAELKYKPLIEENFSGNLLKVAPKTVNLPVSFVMKKDSEVRQGNEYMKFTYVGDLPISIEGETYFDKSDDVYFQVF